LIALRAINFAQDDRPASVLNSSSLLLAQCEGVFARAYVKGNVTIFRGRASYAWIAGKIFAVPPHLVTVLFHGDAGN
jgi:hypothetical protein